MYIYLLLIDEKITEYLMNNSSGSSYPVVNSNIFEKIKIKIPKNKELINEMEPLFNKIELLQSKIKENENLYNKYIQELVDDSLPKK